MIDITHPDQEKYDRMVEALQQQAIQQRESIIIPEKKELPTIGTFLRDQWFQFDLDDRRDLIEQELPFGQWLNRKGYLSRDVADLDDLRVQFQAEL